MDTARTDGPLPGRFVFPAKVVSHFHLRAGDAVADFGAGSGYFTEALAQAVGTEGHLYACDIQKKLVEKIGDLARSKGLRQVHPVWSDLEEENGAPIGAQALDAVLVINTLFQVDDQTALLAEAARVLRRGGKLLVIDWSESFGGLGPHPNDIVSVDQVKALALACGFEYERDFDAGDHHYGLGFRKV